MASTAISNQYYNRVILTTKIVLLAVAVFVMVVVGQNIIQHKFENLKHKIAQGTISPPVTLADRERQLDCLARNIYWEAATEPFEGKVAVAQVTLNRVNSGKFADSVCAVVYQKNIIYEKVICQFSWVCENNHKIKTIHPNYYKESYDVAKKVLLENFRLPGLTEALYYHATYVSPGWRLQKVGQIGQHIFYKE
jgi:spore germination cell wall hydrolase CwlJ-like protein